MHQGTDTTTPQQHVNLLRHDTNAPPPQTSLPQDIGPVRPCGQEKVGPRRVHLKVNKENTNENNKFYYTTTHQFNGRLRNIY